MTATRENGNADTVGRLDYLTRTVDLLWPDAPSMVVLPTTATPRLLVPTRPRRAAASSVLRYTAQQGPRSRFAGAVLAAAVAAGYAATRPPVRSSRAGSGAESIDDHLARVLGLPVVSSLALTRDRPNRKPVLHVFDEHGRTLAFAKIGVTDLSAHLVHHEAAALRRLAAACLRATEVPVVLGDGCWNGLPVIVVSALPTGVALAPGSAPLAAAMREISAVGTGDAADYQQALDERTVTAWPAAGASPVAAAAHELWDDTLRRLREARDVAIVPVGSWHGDWTPWNCARSGARVGAWDWERFADPAPLGFDLLHFVLNHEVAVHRDRFRTAATLLVDGAAELLRPWGLRPAQAEVVALLYLLDIALRYLHDDTRRSGDPAGRVEDWALPVVRHRLGV